MKLIDLDDKLLDSNSILEDNIRLHDYLIKISSYGVLTRNTNITYDDGNNLWNFHDVEFNKQLCWNGNNYIIDDKNNKSISIGKNVSLVEVSGWVTIHSVTKGGAVEVGINKNGQSTGIISFSSSKEDDGTKTIYIEPTPLNVKENDKITLTFCNAAGGKTVLYSSNDRPSTALKVRVIK